MPSGHRMHYYWSQPILHASVLKCSEQKVFVRDEGSDFLSRLHPSQSRVYRANSRLASVTLVVTASEHTGLSLGYLSHELMSGVSELEITFCVSNGRLLPSTGQPLLAPDGAETTWDGTLMHHSYFRPTLTCSVALYPSHVFIISLYIFMCVLCVSMIASVVPGDAHHGAQHRISSRVARLPVVLPRSSAGVGRA